MGIRENRERELREWQAFAESARRLADAIDAMTPHEDETTYTIASRAWNRAHRFDGDAPTVRTITRWHGKPVEVIASRCGLVEIARNNVTRFTNVGSRPVCDSCLGS